MTEENCGAGPVKRFGRTEQGRSGRILWSVYEALEDEDFKNGLLVASFIRREDAWAFVKLLDPPPKLIRPTIAELEKILEGKPGKLEILPNGEVRALPLVEPPADAEPSRNITITCPHCGGSYVTNSADPNPSPDLFQAPASTSGVTAAWPRAVPDSGQPAAAIIDEAIARWKMREDLADAEPPICPICGLTESQTGELLPHRSCESHVAHGGKAAEPQAEPVCADCGKVHAPGCDPPQAEAGKHEPHVFGSTTDPRGYDVRCRACELHWPCPDAGEGKEGRSE